MKIDDVYGDRADKHQRIMMMSALAVINTPIRRAFFGVLNKIKI